MYTSIWAVMSQGVLTSISKSIFILCCTDLRKWTQIFRGRRTDSQIALSWGVAWSVRFQTAFASHWSTGSLPCSYFPVKNILGFAAVFVMRWMEGVMQCVTLSRVSSASHGLSWSTYKQEEAQNYLSIENLFSVFKGKPFCPKCGKQNSKGTHLETWHCWKYRTILLLF